MAEELGQKTNDELIDDLVRAEQREERLVSDLSGSQDSVRDLTERLRAFEGRDIQGELNRALAKTERLWTGLTSWYDKHKRACQYAMQPGGFCPECVWVKRLMATEVNPTDPEAEE